LVGLGLLPGSCCPHYTSEPARALAFRAHVAAGLLPDGYAIGDGAALILDGDKPAGAVVGRAQTGVWRISREGATTRQAMVPAATD
jgi:hypothetical protein